MDIKEIIKKRNGENLALHARYINPQFTKVLKTIGFDKVFERAQGPHLYDCEGRAYLDFLSGYGVFNMGRNHPDIKKVLKEFIDLDMPNLVQMEAPLLSGLLAERLVALLNQDGMDTVYLTSSGTESNETAIKFVKCATGKNRILHLTHAFHGLSTGSLAINGNEEFKNGFGNLLPGTTEIPFNDLNRLEDELKKGDVAAFFFEPIQGKGVFIPKPEFLPKAQGLCRKHGALLVADEIQTGLGRTGKWFAHQHWDLEPDIITIAKSLSGGMVPVGAVITRRWIYDKVFSRMDRCVVHSSTFGQNNMAMVCGLAAIEVIEKENLVERSAKLGELLMEQLQALIFKHEWLKEIRGKGLMIGIEFGKPRTLANKIKWALVHQMDHGLFAEMIVMALLAKHGFLTQVSGHHQDVIKIIPPLIIDQSHATQFVGALDQVLVECRNIGGPIWEMGKNLALHSLARHS